jgi:hypothetical protein
MESSSVANETQMIWKMCKYSSAILEDLNDSARRHNKKISI